MLFSGSLIGFVRPAKYGLSGEGEFYGIKISPWGVWGFGLCSYAARTEIGHQNKKKVYSSSNNNDSEFM